MNATQKSEALRLADKYEARGFLGDHSFAKEQWCSQAAVELRRQHTRIAELEAQLSAIGAGGVEPLRKQAAPAAPAATPIAWCVTGCSTMLDECDAKAEAKRCGGSAKAVPLYAAPPALAATQPAAQGLDAETQRHAAIGKAIERACMDLPDGTEISVSLEKDAGTVTLIDQDGNEHENFSCDYSFAGVLNEAIDAAIADQAKQGE